MIFACAICQSDCLMRTCDKITQKFSKTVKNILIEEFSLVFRGSKEPFQNFRGAGMRQGRTVWKSAPSERKLLFSCNCLTFHFFS